MKIDWLEEWRKTNLIKVLEGDICRELQITKEQLKRYDFSELSKPIEKRSGKPMEQIVPLCSRYDNNA